MTIEYARSTNGHVEHGERYTRTYDDAKPARPRRGARLARLVGPALALLAAFVLLRLLSRDAD